jgi:exodeoxyribonuclease V alpha subunit
MLRRNLLYTAVTRTMDKLIMLGTQKALAIGVKNSNEQERYTGLFKQQKAVAL